MSKTIDERVVEMRFDNKQFESNVQTSLSTIEKLKKSLDMDGATKGLESIDSAAKKVDMSGLGSAVETVKTRFSALEIMAVTALANITNSVVNTGKQMLQSLTIEPISQGFEEYELKMGSIQTIMMSTGASLEEVNKYLQELNTYSDKTIYSFQDMTSNIGKFTNAGVGLEDAVMAIQGVSNVAAVSGANANEASRAMYNFAQALSAGYVKLIDWKSIENANMATVEFKTQLLESAVACGTLTKTADGMYKTVKGNVIDATHGFNDSLQDQWMTTEALVGTLRNYADETTEIGAKAFAAAQDVKTFTQLIDTLKEAVGSGWANTWEILFGDFEEAKELWTGLSQVIGGFIDAQADARNEMLQGWKDLGGRTYIIEGISIAWKNVTLIVGKVKEAFNPGNWSVVANITAKINEVKNKIDGKYTGDMNYKGGLTWLAERGRELVKYPSGEMTVAASKAVHYLPPGTRIYSNSDTEKILNTDSLSAEEHQAFSKLSSVGGLPQYTDNKFKGTSSVNGSGNKEKSPEASGGINIVIHNNYGNQTTAQIKETNTDLSQKIEKVFKEREDRKRRVSLA